MYAQKDLQDWQATWIMNNEHVSCLECAAQQPSRLSNTDFVHSPQCSSCGGKGQRPWEQLMHILTVPGAQADSR